MQTTDIKDDCPFIPAYSLFIVWTIHVVLTELNDPFGLVFDAILWITASILKVITILSLPVLLDQSYQYFYKKPKSAVQAFFIWFFIGTFITVGLALTRNFWAPILSTDTVTFYSYFSEVEKSCSLPIEHCFYWHTAWSNGKVILFEIMLVLSLSIFHSINGYFLGYRKSLAPIIGFIFSFIILFFYSYYSNWYVTDFDNFHGDIYSGSVLFDLIIFFIAIDPYTTIAMFIYVGIAFSCFIISQVNSK